MCEARTDTTKSAHALSSLTCEANRTVQYCAHHAPPVLIGCSDERKIALRPSSCLLLERKAVAAEPLAQSRERRLALGALRACVRRSRSHLQGLPRGADPSAPRVHSERDQRARDDGPE